MDFTICSRCPGSSFVKNAAADRAVHVRRSEYWVSSLRGQLSAEELSADSISTAGSLNVRHARGFFPGIPRTFLHACDGELSVDHIRTFRDWILADNGKDAAVEYVETRDVTDDLVAIPQEPARTELLRGIGNRVKVPMDFWLASDTRPGPE
ncbi:hypothetical protein CALCODRAFT_484753 [Calocera cornea HHB12733]|uniref:Uncharacterized protein n=1 Tax=Calocera cornea HHB12733 TaxID=1353952 RepID=A0A165ETD7_9BASI|nr:hypothetical protein CALCODRAFT_484753 [Calocera cornea HHB12733]